MSTVSTPLRYLWHAIYEDGFVFEQPEDDKSAIFPEVKVKGGGVYQPSAFKDVEEHVKKHGRLYAFWLVEDGQPRYGVNLINGIISLNGTAYEPYIDERFSTLPHDFKLVFFREIHRQNIDGVVQPAYVNRYILGWETKGQHGKNHKHILGLGA